MSTTKANERKKLKMLLRDKGCFNCIYQTDKLLKNLHIVKDSFCVYRKNIPKYGVCLKHQQEGYGRIY